MLTQLYLRAFPIQRHPMWTCHCCNTGIPDPASGWGHSACELIPYNLTLGVFEATYAEPMLPVEMKARATAIAERPPPPKQRTVIPASQRVVRELGRLHGTGL